MRNLKNVSISDGNVKNYDSDHDSDSSGDYKDPNQDLHISDDTSKMSFHEVDECIENITAFAKMKGAQVDVIQKLHCVHREIRKHSISQKIQFIYCVIFQAYDK